jgi:acyl-CoA synthetase (AMP-forming)/AMP-acid ligase II
VKHEQTFAIAAANGRRPADLVALLRWNAQIRPDKLAYVFLDDGEREAARVTFAELDRRARTIAAHLQDRVAPGARALLLFPPGLDYIEAFFGCLYAKVTAVPAYPPKGRHLQRLSSIWNDADPALVLTTTPLAKQIQNVAFHGSAAAFYTTDQLVEQTGEDWRPATISADDIAFLQYTSGSTADPRGVMVSHGNLIANEALIKESFRHDETSTLVGWLPLYHDMGLVGNILQPLYVGATAYLMSPMAFLEMPVRWLRAISKYNAHTSGGPNFGYELCVRKISEEDKNELDLGGWKVAFSGAEPVRAATLDRFTRGFAQCGFRRESFYPCYGLAEATLVVSAPPESRQTPILSLDKKALEQHHAMTTEQNGLNVVGCGRPWSDHDMRIVDPTALTECVNGEIGEIWVSGPCIAKGYWRREAQTRDTFGATIHGGDGSTYLRSGDLGFLDKGELYVTGRIKDLIIVAGKNYYPHDIEAAIEDLVEGLRPGGVTAAPTSDDEEDSFILFAEPHRSALPTLKSDNARSLIHAIGQAIADAIDIAPCEIVVLNPGATPKTSSGKTRRGECRRAYYSGEIDILARSSDLAKHSESAQPRLVDSRASLLQLALAQLAPEQRRPLLARLLVAEAARAVGINESEIDADAPISRIGLHSLKAIELRHTIENMSGVALPLAILLSDASFSEVAGIMSELEIEDRSPVSTNDHCLSFTQQAMWTVQHLDAASNVYNLHLALDIGPIDASRFEAALRATIDANAQLRTVYHNAETGPQAIERRASQYEAPLDDIDASAWGSDELLADASRRIIEPFDIESQIPLRVALYRLAHGNLLLFVAHHISVDLCPNWTRDIAAMRESPKRPPIAHSLRGSADTSSPHAPKTTGNIGAISSLENCRI